MSHRSEIDKQLAEIERMAGLGSKSSQSSSLDTADSGASGTGSPKSGPARFLSWPVIIGAAAVIDIGARLFIPASDQFVRVFEGVIFGGAAIALALPLFRKSDLSGTRRKLHGWLAAAFGMGGLRSVMWGLGAPVELANLTILLLGLAGLAGWYFVRKKNRPPTSDFSGD